MSAAIARYEIVFHDARSRFTLKTFERDGKIVSELSEERLQTGNLVESLRPIRIATQRPKPANQARVDLLQRSSRETAEAIVRTRLAAREAEAKP